MKQRIPSKIISNKLRRVCWFICAVSLCLTTIPNIFIMFFNSYQPSPTLTPEIPIHHHDVLTQQGQRKRSAKLSGSIHIPFHQPI